MRCPNNDLQLPYLTAARLVKATVRMLAMLP
jgi:hypothetical protein